MLKEYQETIIELLGQLESDMSNLYKLFADKFPTHKDLWLAMSQQELEHIEQVKTLHSMAKNNKITFDEKLTKTYTVKRVLEVIKNTHIQAETNKLTLLNALSISRDLEGSILEKEFYNFFSSIDPEAKMLINGIKAGLLEHNTKLRNAWEEERNK